MDYTKTLKLRFRVGDLGLPQRRKRYTSSRGEEEEDAQMCSCGKVVESKNRIRVGECEIYQEERDVLEMRKMDERGTEEFGTLDSSEKTIAILGDVHRWWPQPATQEGREISKKCI